MCPSREVLEEHLDGKPVVFLELEGQIRSVPTAGSIQHPPCILSSSAFLFHDNMPKTRCTLVHSCGDSQSKIWWSHWLDIWWGQRMAVVEHVWRRDGKPGMAESDWAQLSFHTQLCHQNRAPRTLPSDTRCNLLPYYLSTVIGCSPHSLSAIGPWLWDFVIVPMYGNHFLFRP